MSNPGTSSPLDAVPTLETPGRSMGRAAARVMGALQRSSEWVFIREVIAAPRSMGALLPSSRRLGRMLAGSVRLPQRGIVVELGPGTGVVTSALLKHGIEQDRMVVVERSRRMADHLKARFESLRVIRATPLACPSCWARAVRP